MRSLHHALMYAGIGAALLLLPSSTVSADRGETEQRTRELIERLQSETLVESLENLGEQEAFTQPGYLPPTAGENTLDIVHKLFSNRRVVKIYQEFKDLSRDEQYQLLHSHFIDYVKENAAARRAIALGTYDQRERNFLGSLRAAQSLALISGMLGNTRMWPHLREAFRFPVAGLALNLNTEEIDDSRVAGLRSWPLFSAKLQAQVVYQMADSAGAKPLAEVGLSKSRVLNTVGDIAMDEPSSETIRFIRLLDYRSRQTRYDNTSETSVDLSHGSRHVKVLALFGESEIEKIARLAEAD